MKIDFTLPGLLYEMNALTSMITEEVFDYYNGKYDVPYGDNLAAFVKNKSLADLPIVEINEF